jgi:hypothetical protein
MYGITYRMFEWAHVHLSKVIQFPAGTWVNFRAEQLKANPVDPQIDQGVDMWRPTPHGQDVWSPFGASEVKS